MTSMKSGPLSLSAWSRISLIASFALVIFSLSLKDSHGVGVNEAGYGVVAAPLFRHGFCYALMEPCAFLLTILRWSHEQHTLSVFPVESVHLVEDVAGRFESWQLVEGESCLLLLCVTEHPGIDVLGVLGVEELEDDGDGVLKGDMIGVGFGELPKVLGPFYGVEAFLVFGFARSVVGVAADGEGGARRVEDDEGPVAGSYGVFYVLLEVEARVAFGRQEVARVGFEATVPESG